MVLKFDVPSILLFMKQSLLVGSTPPYPGTFNLPESKFFLVFAIYKPKKPSPICDGFGSDRDWLWPMVVAIPLKIGLCIIDVAIDAFTIHVVNIRDVNGVWD